MKSIKSIFLTIFLLLQINSFGQSNYDSTFIKEIINLELKERDKKINKAYPIFYKSEFSEIHTSNDTIYTEYYLGKEINWVTFEIKSKYGFFTFVKTTDSCLYIHAPLFNKSSDKFVIKYEVRFQNLTSFFIVDIYRKRKGKWNFVSSSKNYSF